MPSGEQFSRTTRIDILPDFLKEPDGRIQTDYERLRQSTVPRVDDGAGAGKVGESDFQELLQSSYDAALLTDLDGQILDANMRAIQFLGCSREKLCTGHVSEVISGLEAGILETVRKTLEDDRFVLLQAYCARDDSSVFPTEIAIIRLGLASQTILCFFIRDITLRKKTEDMLRVGHRAIQNAGTGIAMVDMYGFIQLVNPTMLSMWRVKDEEQLLEKPIQELLCDASSITDAIGKAQKGEGWHGEVEAQRKDGSHFYAELSAAPNINADDEVVGLVLSVLDITERKEAEVQLHATMEELARSNADLEQFAYVVSHDLQEPLRKIVQFGELLKNTTEGNLTEEGEGYLGRMQGGAKRMGDLIKGILALSRVSTRARKSVPVDLNEIVREVVSDLEIRIMETNGHVETVDLPAVEAEPIQMRQLMLNLIGNGLKFHRKDVQPVVKVSGEYFEEDSDSGSESMRKCRLVIDDNGIGFENRDAERIFGIFARLHRRNEYEGTGIGLAICRKIVERHGGTITAEGRPGDGSSFTVVLPLAPQPQ
jgi:PAS domain S-box-containing protein